MEHFKIIEPSLNENITAEFAQSKDMNEVQRLLLNTALWLQQNGSNQWEGLLQGKDVHNTKDAIQNNQVVIFRFGETMIGTVTLFSNPSPWDQALWNDADKAVYLHRITVNRIFKGQGLGRLIMTWVEKGIEYRTAQKLRLDCVSHTQTLNRFYISLGYAFKGEKKGYNLYEKSIDKA